MKFWCNVCETDQHSTEYHRYWAKQKLPPSPKSKQKISGWLVYDVKFSYWQRSNHRSRVDFCLRVLATSKRQAVSTARSWLGLRRGQELRFKFGKKERWETVPKVLTGQEVE